MNTGGPLCLRIPPATGARPDAPRGLLYAVLARHFLHHHTATRDLQGHLLTEHGEVLWSHLDHHPRALLAGLAATGANREALLERYPGGYTVVYADRPGIVPQEVLDANRVRYDPSATP